jgi:amino acid adenylation domain-containing protein
MTSQPNTLWKSEAARMMYRELPPVRPVCTRRSCLPQLVEAAVALHPEASALLAPNGEAMSYVEFDRRSSRLAGYLRALGVGPEVVVAICLERSFDFVIAALAAWKAGGAYLPLDPAWPADGRQRIVEDARASVLITKAGLASRARYVVDLDLDAPAIAREAAVCPAVPVKREDLACVIYASDSASRPRGVELTHGNLLNLVFWHRRTFGVTPADRATHVAGIASEAGVWDLWPYLTAGAAIAIPAESTRRSPELLREWLTAQSITIGFVPAALAEPLIARRWPRSTALRYLLTGGDTLHRYPASGLPFRVVNHYGLAECTAVATSGEIPAEPDVTLPTIGAPVAHTQIHFLDADQRPVAAGEIGEIYISGPGVARGYRNRADLTAERFLENPFSIAWNARMYRTGDRGRALPGGRVALSGRTGEQETIRGQRVDEHEIVRVLDRHPGVISSAAAPGRGSNQRLVAYVVPTSAPDLTAAVLREFLARQLPRHMVPSVFVRLAELPLDSSGKLDRAALPNPSKENCLPGSGFRPPATPVERQLAAMLMDLLRLDSIGLEDSSCPADADVAARFMVRVRGQFGVELSRGDLVQYETVANLAVEIERRILSQLESMTEEQSARLLSLDAACRRS